MAKEIDIYVGGVVKKVKKVPVCIGGVIKEAKKGVGGVGGAVKEFFTSGLVTKINKEQGGTHFTTNPITDGKFYIGASGQIVAKSTSSYGYGVAIWGDFGGKTLTVRACEVDTVGQIWGYETSDQSEGSLFKISLTTSYATYTENIPSNTGFILVDVGGGSSSEPAWVYISSMKVDDYDLFAELKEIIENTTVE